MKFSTAEILQNYEIVTELKQAWLDSEPNVSGGHETKEPAPEAVLKVFEETKRCGVLIGKGGLYGNVIRTGMMLNSTKDNVDELVAALDKGFALC